MIDVLVPAKSAHVITTQLVAAEGQPSTDPGTEDRVQVWPQPAGSTCVVVEHWVDSKASRDFIVPAGDPDCDSVSRECDPAAANGALTKDGVFKAANCFVTSTDSAAQACRLGALGCSDATGPTDMCLVTHDEVCVPKAFCACLGEQPDETCTRPTLEGPAEGVPHIACTVRLSAVGVACKDHSELIQLNHHLGNNNNCEQPMLSPLDLTNLGAIGKSHNFGGVDLELTSPDKECGFQVQVNSGSPSDGEAFGMVTLMVEQHTVLLPIRFTFTSLAPPCAVDMPMDCRFTEAPDDPMWGCVP
jgi:hypothetical protein